MLQNKPYSTNPKNEEIQKQEIKSLSKKLTENKEKDYNNNNTYNEELRFLQLTNSNKKQKLSRPIRHKIKRYYRKYYLFYKHYRQKQRIKRKNKIIPKIPIWFSNER